MTPVFISAGLEAEERLVIHCLTVEGSHNTMRGEEYSFFCVAGGTANYQHLQVLQLNSPVAAYREVDSGRLFRR